MKDHNFFKWMHGNPQSITLMANLRLNPIQTNEKVYRTLYDLNMIKSEEIKKLLEDENVDTDIFSNENSLRISHEFTLLQLQLNDKDAYTFYFFMGLLPGGLTKEQCQIMWGDSWQKCLETLDKIGFIE